MKLYVARGCPNPRRVTIFLAEKGAEIEQVTLDLAAGAQRSPEFLRKNPAGQVPLLELDDGAYLPESAAIVEYLDEVLPGPSLIGRTPLERARVRALERVAADVITRLGAITLNTHPRFASIPGLVQYPEVAKAMQAPLVRTLEALEGQLGGRPFLAGATPTIADCTLFAVLSVCYRLYEYELPADLERLRGWFERFGARRSALWGEI